MSYWFSFPYCLLQFYCSSASYLCSLKVVVYVTRFTPYWDTDKDIQSDCLFWAPPFFKGPNQRSFGIGKLSCLCSLSTWHGKTREEKMGAIKILFHFSLSQCLIFGFLNRGNKIWVLLSWERECVPGRGPGWRKESWAVTSPWLSIALP